MNLCHFEDRAEQFEPLSLTRPVFDLLCGMTPLWEKQKRRFPGTRRGVWIRSELKDYYQAEHPELPVNNSVWLRDRDVILVNSRWLPPSTGIESIAGPCVALIEGEVAFAVVTARHLEAFDNHLPSMLQHWKETLPTRLATGCMLQHPWDLVAHNAEEIGFDFQALEFARRPCKSSAYLAVVGPIENLWIDPSAKVEPLVVADTTQGPIVIEPEASVSAFTRLEGPCYIGPRTQVFGAKIRAGTTLGPQCRIGGEIEASIVHGHSNKYHEGFLGHSYLGEWINLAAGTQNSDLRNDYGEVSVPLRGESIATGQNKVGCFIGDHAKTGLSTLLNTGSSVGPFCNLLPSGRYAPKYIPAFASWWNGALCEAFTMDQLLTTAERAMRRRGVELTEAHREFYTLLHQATARERQRVLSEHALRQLRKSA